MLQIKYLLEVKGQVRGNLPFYHSDVDPFSLFVIHISVCNKGSDRWSLPAFSHSFFHSKEATMKPGLDSVERCVD